jgi:uncharacterized protein
MRILAVSDQVVERVYELAPHGHFNGVQLLLSCGDLPYEYLEYLVSVLNLTLFYIPGNHDPAYNASVPRAHVEGGINLDLKTARSHGLLLAGLGGSVQYRPDSVNQYTQSGAFRRALQLAPALLWNRQRYGRALDVFVTHSPPYGIHDDDSEAHRGLKAINWLLSWAHPRYHLHGHMHSLRRNLEPELSQVGGTTIVNIFPYRILEIDDGQQS